MEHITLLVCSTMSYWPMVELTSANRQEYCSRHGIQLRERLQHYYDPWGERNQMMAEELSECTRLLFMDTDTLITNISVPPESLFQKMDTLTISRDVNGMNNGVFFLKNNEQGSRFLEKTLAGRGKYDNDQLAMEHAISQLPHLPVSYVPQRQFNSYLYNEYPYGPNPGSWCYGDFALHLPGLSFAKRMQLLEAYKTEVHR